MTASKAMGALGLMNTRALEHPITGTQFLQEKVGSMNFLCRRFLLLKPLEDIFLHISASLEAEIEYGLNLYLFQTRDLILELENKRQNVIRLQQQNLATSRGKKDAKLKTSLAKVEYNKVVDSSNRMNKSPRPWGCDLVNFVDHKV